MKNKLFLCVFTLSSFNFLEAVRSRKPVKNATPENHKNLKSGNMKQQNNQAALDALIAKASTVQKNKNVKNKK